jgi:hypothetical protein
MSARLCLLRDFTRLAKMDVTDPNLSRPEDERGHTFAKLDFHRLGKRVLRAITAELGLQSGTFDIRSNLGGPAVSGEVTLHGEHIYISFSEGDSFMYRSCNGRKDYTSGANHWMLWDDLLDLPRACETFKLIARG